jgi:hypothetical protein
MLRLAGARADGAAHCLPRLQVSGCCSAGGAHAGAGAPAASGAAGWLPPRGTPWPGTGVPAPAAAGPAGEGACRWLRACGCWGWTDARWARPTLPSRLGPRYEGSAVAQLLTPTPRLQVPLLQQAEAEAMKLVLRAEQLRSALGHVGSLYRCTFGWLLRCLKLAEGARRPPPAAAGGGGAAATAAAAGPVRMARSAWEPRPKEAGHADKAAASWCAGVQPDPNDPDAPKPSILRHPPAVAEVAELLEGQLLVDGIAPELEVGSSGCWWLLGLLVVAGCCCGCWRRWPQGSCWLVASAILGWR